jgi:hypothetical protein
LVLELEHLKIETRLISDRFANAMGECENLRTIAKIESHVAAGFLEKSKTQKSKFALDKAAAALRQRGQRQQRCEASEIMWRVLVHVRTCFLANFSSLCTALEAVA